MRIASSRPGRMTLAVFVALAWSGLPARAQRIYWTDSGSQKIQRANLDGTNIEDLVTGVVQPAAIALDLASGKMYWTECFVGILRADLDGSNQELLVSTSARGLALDLAGGRMFWTGCDMGIIRCSNLDGSNVVTLANVGLSPFDIALDLGAGKMYWPDRDADVLRRADLDGSNIETVCPTGPNGGGWGVALDIDSGKVYWADLSRIEKANMEAGCNERELLLQNLGYTRSVALNLDAGKIYWADANLDSIERANLDGSGREDVIPNLDNPTGIALDLRPSCGRGNVNLGVSATATDVLFVNGEGSVATVPAGNAITVSLDAAPMGPAPGEGGADYVLWMWLGDSSNPFDLDVGTSVLGCVTNPTPLHPFAGPQPFRCLNGGMPSVFCGDVGQLASPPRAPWSATKGSGFGNPVVFVLQGVLEDFGALSSDGFSVTNRVVLQVE